MTTFKGGETAAVGDRCSFVTKGIHPVTRVPVGRREGVVVALGVDGWATVGSVHLDVIRPGGPGQVVLPRVALTTVKLAECDKVG